MSIRAIQRLFAVLLAVLAVNPGARAQEEYTGEFVVRSAGTQLIDGTYYVNADIDLSLSPEAADMLRAPVPLTIRIEIEFLNRLRLWWDPSQFEKAVQYQLSYLRVRDRYQVRDLDSERAWNFVELREALDFIGQVENLEFVDEAELDDDHRYNVRVRAVLDKRDLPGPLRLMAFWRKDWSIASDWLTWRLDDE